jgi:hypothetical protein
MVVHAWNPRQEDGELKASLSYTGRPWLKNKIQLGAGGL